MEKPGRDGCSRFIITSNYQKTMTVEEPLLLLEIPYKYFEGERLKE
jgi:hypothetical protein